MLLILVDQTGVRIGIKPRALYRRHRRLLRLGIKPRALYRRHRRLGPCPKWISDILHFRLILIKIPGKNAWYFYSGPDGSRTRVRNPIPRTSTSLVTHLSFPPCGGDRQPPHFSSFIIRPPAQSFASVVSHIVDALI